MKHHPNTCTYHSQKADSNSDKRVLDNIFNKKYEPSLTKNEIKHILNSN